MKADSASGQQMSRHFEEELLDPEIEAVTEAGDRLMRIVATVYQFTYPSDRHSSTSMLESLTKYPDALMTNVADKIEYSDNQKLWGKTITMLMRSNPPAELIEGFMSVCTTANISSTYVLYARIIKTRYFSDDPYASEQANTESRRAAVSELADFLCKYASGAQRNNDAYVQPPLAGLTEDENGTLSLLIRNPEKATMISDAIKERVSVDIGFLHELLAIETVALSSGML